jgi:hypothetical protein
MRDAGFQIWDKIVGNRMPEAGDWKKGDPIFI